MSGNTFSDECVNVRTAGWAPVPPDLATIAAALDGHAPDCAFCDGPVITPVRDAEAATWLGDAASVYCSAGCLASAQDAAVEAEAR